jgi:hypothetical protein
VLKNLTYLAASLIAILVITLIAPNTAAAVALSVTLIALMAVLATLSGDPADLARIIDAVANLIRGRPDP